MHLLFEIVYKILKQISVVTGLTYNEINIVVYYIIAPMIYFVMIDKILKTHLLKIIFGVIVIVTIVVSDFGKLSDSMFDSSVDFLLWFELIGWDYVVSSVIICVIIPFLVFVVLFYFSFWPILKREYEKMKSSDT